jgi:hypothetical protein
VTALVWVLVGVCLSLLAAALFVATLAGRARDEAHHCCQYANDQLGLAIDAYSRAADLLTQAHEAAAKAKPARGPHGRFAPKADR